MSSTAIRPESSGPWDLIVIGGGAAGFFGAITFAGARPSSRTLILEKGPRILAKVAISGGGRCNVTHHCFEPRELVKHYPRGGRALIGAFHHWQPRDTVDWFEARGVRLKTEPDGRMFPLTDDSQTIIDCLTGQARKWGVDVRTHHAVQSISVNATSPESRHRFRVHLANGAVLQASRILIATGGPRDSDTLASALGHRVIAPAPSLFTFHIHDPLFKGLAGLAVGRVELSVPGNPLRQQGPLLITHSGLSGPAVLKLSAWGARWMQEQNYQFPIEIDWIPDMSRESLAERFREVRELWNRKKVATLSPFETIPNRLWERLVRTDLNWSGWSKAEEQALTQRLKRGRFEVAGKSMNKEEFVTAGGVDLGEVELKTMESRLVPGLYLAGEALDVDGVTGGFNFQAAWTTGYLAGVAAAESL